MAKLVVCSVFDSCAQVFGTPMFFRSKGEALRSWDEECNRAESVVAKHPEDFSLMEIGTYDDSTGMFEALPAVSNLGLAASYKKHDALVKRPQAVTPAPELTQ